MNHFPCPCCGATLQVPAALVGHKVECGKCGRLLQVPAASERQTEPSAKPQRKGDGWFDGVLWREVVAFFALLALVVLAGWAIRKTMPSPATPPLLGAGRWNPQQILKAPAYPSVPLRPAEGPRPADALRSRLSSRPGIVLKAAQPKNWTTPAPLPEVPPPPLASSPTERRRFTMKVRDGTHEVRALFAKVSPGERNLFRESAGPNKDIFGFHLEITNPGSDPIRFDPNRFRIHYGSESTPGQIFLLNPAFLQTCLLEPGHSTQGLIMYVALPETAAAIGLGEVRITYDDPYVEVHR